MYSYLLGSTHPYGLTDMHVACVPPALVCARYGVREGRGPALGGVCLGKLTDSSETRVAARLPTRQSVHAVKTLRSRCFLRLCFRFVVSEGEGPGAPSAAG